MKKKIARIKLAFRKYDKISWAVKMSLLFKI